MTTPTRYTDRERHLLRQAGQHARIAYALAREVYEAHAQVVELHKLLQRTESAAQHAEAAGRGRG